MAKIILASQSPRRRELLAKLGIDFDVVPSSYEEHLDENRAVEDVAKELSLGKAKDVAVQHLDAYVIGSDTIVAVNGRQMEKAVDIDDAREMLLTLTGKESTVSTGIAIVNVNKNIELVAVDTAKVYFKANSPEIAKQREAYLATEDWRDKAGGYGIQSGGGFLIDHIDGDYDTIVGLPTRKLKEMLLTLGISK